MTTGRRLQKITFSLAMLDNERNLAKQSEARMSEWWNVVAR